MKTTMTAVFISLALCTTTTRHANADFFSPINLSGVANRHLQDVNSAYPSGSPVILGGVPFNIPPVGNNYFNTQNAAGGGPGTVTLTVPINMTGVTGVDTLINTLWGESGPGTLASLTFTFSDNTMFVKPLDGNVDIRDYYQSIWTNSINGTTTTNVFTTDNDGPAGPNLYRLDKQFIDLSAFSGKTLVSMTLTDTGRFQVQRTFLSGVTVRSVRPRCDFNSDLVCNIDDLNAMLGDGPIAPGVTITPGVNGQFDLTGDGVIDNADVDRWLADAATVNGYGSSYKRGDANLDGLVDGSDFGLWNANKFTSTLSWDQGNFDGDAATDGSDFGLWNANKFMSSVDSSAVPEPNAATLVLIGAILGEFANDVNNPSKRYPAPPVWCPPRFAHGSPPRYLVGPAGLFSDPDNFDQFGSSVALLGDLDGDGLTDLAVGAYGDDTGDVDRGAVHLLFLNADGSVKNSLKIDSDTNGGPNLANLGQFGSAVTALGDLDGNGVTELAVGATGDDTGGVRRGAVHVVFLNPDGSVKNSLKIASDTNGGPTLADHDQFGRSVASPADLDGDGINDLIVGATGDNTGGDRRGAVYVLFLDADGSVKGSRKIGSDTNGGPTLEDIDRFGSSVPTLGDLDGDGLTDLAIGAYGDDTGGGSRGAVHVLFLDVNTDLTELVVDNMDDEDDGNYAVGELSFREAIALANAIPGSNTILFDPGLDNAVLSLNRGELAIDDDLIIDASSLANGLTIDASANESPSMNCNSNAPIINDQLVAISAPNDNTTASQAGAVYIFSASTGQLVRTITSPFAQAGDQFGTSLAAVGEGKLLVGSQRDSRTDSFAGAAYLFDVYTGDLLQTLRDPNPELEDRFGRSVASAGEILVVGAQSDGAVDHGGAFVFENRATSAFVRVIDDGEPGFNHSQAFNYYPGEGFRGDVYFAGGDNSGDVAEWTFSQLPAGWYQVSATWTTNANRATNSPFTVKDGNAALNTVRVNQELAPNDFTFLHTAWEDLGGPYYVTSGTLTVELSDDADEFILADAVRVEKISGIPGDAMVAPGSIRSAATLAREKPLPRNASQSRDSWDVESVDRAWADFAVERPQMSQVRAGRND